MYKTFKPSSPYKIGADWVFDAIRTESVRRCCIYTKTSNAFTGLLIEVSFYASTAIGDSNLRPIGIATVILRLTYSSLLFHRIISRVLVQVAQRWIVETRPVE